MLAWWRERGAISCERHDVPSGIGFTACAHVGAVDIARTTTHVEEPRAALAPERSPIAS